MTIYNISVWRLAALILIFSLIDTLVSKNKHVVAELSVIPLWNFTTNISGTESCRLTKADNNLQDVVKFTGDTVETCSVQLKSSNGTAALIWIPQGALVYAERQEDIPYCQMKYIYVTSDHEPCSFVFRHPNVQLFLRGEYPNGSIITISQMSVNTSAPICQDGNGSKGQHTSRVSQTSHCEALEFDDLISCNLSPDYTCSFKFPGDCNVTFGNRVVNFQCLDNNVHSSYKALTVYPPGIITLDLTRQRIVELNVNTFVTLKSLKSLLLAYNDLFVLPSGLLLGLNNLEYLTLTGNRLSLLDGSLFNETKKLANLVLRKNNLKQLPEILFYGLGNLNKLNLDENDLTVLPKGLFRELTNLEYLYLSSNQIKSLIEALFNETNKLTKLHLEDNSLTILPKGSFMGLRNLEILDLGENQIQSLDVALFKETNKLYFLNLADNDLTILPNELFMGMGNLKILTLNENQISLLDGCLFHKTNKLTELYLRSNDLTTVPNGLLMGLTNLEILKLNKNQITSLHENLFNDTKNLIELGFYHNNLKHLSNNLFKELSDLRALDLDDNKIIEINKKMFRDLSNLRYLHLRNNHLKALEFNLFQYTTKIGILDLSGNELVNIPDISNLRQLRYLNVKDNKMNGITNETFSNLPKKADLVVSQHEICECYLPNGVICTATDDRSPFLTCDRLLSDRVLMVLMWLIGLNALCGNVFVLSQKKKSTDKNKVQNFLLRNLAMSDLLMGFYMLLIASTDIYFGEHFPLLAETWRSGITCRIAGTISIVSSEASVFFVTLISIDRFVSIKYHNSSRKLRKKSSAVVAIVLWTIALVLGVVPSSLAGKNDKFYDNSHVCIGLPLSKLQVYKTNESKTWIEICPGDDICYWKQPIQSKYVGEVTGMVFASVIFLGLNFICYLVIFACYVEIIQTVFKSSKRAGLNPEMKEQIRLTAKVAAIVLTDFACWFPIIIIGILVQAGVLTLPPDVFAWCVTFVLPINSAINPYLYTIAAIINSRLKRARIAPVENQQENTNRASSHRGQMPGQSQDAQGTTFRSVSHDTPPNGHGFNI